MTHQEIKARSDELTAQYEAACAAALAARGTDAFPALLAEQKRLNDLIVTERRYWREVGEAVGAFIDRAAEGARVEIVKVRNYDGSI